MSKTGNKFVFMIIFLIMFICIFVLKSGGVMTFAADGHDIQIIDNGDGTQTVITVYKNGIQKEILTFDFNDDEYFTMYGKHVNSGSTIHYYTQGYNFTIDRSDGMLSCVTRKYVERATYAEAADKEIIVDGKSMLLSEYCIKWSDIYEAAEYLFTQKYGAERAMEMLTDSEGVDLYMSNVFQTRYRSGGTSSILKRDIIDLDEMKRAEAWSQGTLDLLGAYYDIRIHISKFCFTTDKLRTNCVDCAQAWAASGVDVKNEAFTIHPAYCAEHDGGSGIWCEITSSYVEEETSSYTLPGGTVKRFDAKTYEIRSADSGAAAGSKWVFDGKLEEGEAETGRITDCSAVMIYTDGNGVIGNAVPYGDFSEYGGGVFQLYARPNKGKNKIGMKLDGAQLENYDRIIILPFVSGEDSYEVTAAYITVKEQGQSCESTGTVFKQAAGYAAKGEIFSFNSEKVIEGTDGKLYGIIDKESVKSIYAYAGTKYNQAADTNSMEVSRNSNGSGYLLRTQSAHEQEKKATLYIPVELYDGEAQPDKPPETAAVEISYFEPDASGQICSDIFEVNAAIPATECVYVSADASKYLFSCKLTTTTGTKVYNVMVKQPYVLNYKSADGKQNLMRTGISILTVPVNREYSYSEISSLEYYVLDSFTVNNAAMQTPQVVLFAKEEMPQCNYVHYQGEAEHLLDPEHLEREVVLPELIVSSSSSEVPNLPGIDESAAQAAAQAAVGKLRVRSDMLQFAGSYVLNDDWQQEKTQSPVTSAISRPSKLSVKSADIGLPADRANMQFSSSGNVKYKASVRYASSKPDTVTYVLFVNNINIHTPVYCQGVVECDNTKYVQTVQNSTAAVQLVLGRAKGYGTVMHENDSCDMTVSVNNFGQHINAKGYGSRDYSKNFSGLEGGSYIARAGSELMNQVRFPFDVYIDTGNDRLEANDILLKSGEWYTLGLRKQRVYVPLWVEEREYEIDFRTVAVNGNEQSVSQSSYNANRSAYAADDNISAFVSGKLYGFTLYDINSSLEWENVFKLGTTLKINHPGIYADGTLGDFAFNERKQYYYTAGDKNELGLSTGRNARFCVPLLAGSHPAYQNIGVLKAGYTWRFKLKTTGTKMSYDTSYIKIKPSFWWILDGESEREEVDIYYTERINDKKRALIKVGDAIDALNVKQTYSGSAGLAVPVKEREVTALLRSCTLSEWDMQYGAMYTYGMISSNNIFKTFNDQARLEQTYYFEYSLPHTMHAVKKGYDVAGQSHLTGGIDYTEDFWKRGGYIIVSFDIIAYDSTGSQYLTYGTAGAGENMWLTEGFMQSRWDYGGTSFDFLPGDVFLLYADRTINSDYVVDHLN